MIAPLTTLLALSATAPLAIPDQAKNSVATCFVRKVVNDEEVGPKLVVGWRFRDADRGAVSYDAGDIHDPAGLLGGRVFTTIVKDAAMRMFLFRSDPSRKLEPLALSFKSDDNGKSYSGGVLASMSGDLHSIYFGSCVVKDYGSSSDAIFAKLKSYGARDFQ